MNSQVMGIVNINDDSFSNDGTLDPAGAIAIARQHLQDGAHIIDIGAESARTNRGPISCKEESDRLISFLSLRHELPPHTLSINTWRTDVLKTVLANHHVDLINDISGLPDARNAELAAEHSCKLLIMHSVGEPKVPHFTQLYTDIWDTLLQFFEEKITLAESVGLRREDIILDPGIDFAKQRDDNLRIYKEIAKLNQFNLPLLIPVSRKTVIKNVLGIENPVDRDAATIACIAACHHSGRHIYRVHNCKVAADRLKVLDAISA